MCRMQTALCDVGMLRNRKRSSQESNERPDQTLNRQISVAIFDCCDAFDHIDTCFFRVCSSHHGLVVRQRRIHHRSRKNVAISLLARRCSKRHGRSVHPSARFDQDPDADTQGTYFDDRCHAADHSESRDTRVRSFSC